MATKITFSQFGDAFVNAAVTEQTLYDSIGPTLQRTAVPPIDQQVSLAHVTGQGRIDVGQLRVARCEPASTADQTIAFDVFFGIRLTLYIHFGVGQENYEVNALVHLRLLAETWADPLCLYFPILPVPPSEVQVQVTGEGNWLNLAQRFGLGNQVESAIAQRVNGMLDTPAANASRTINIQEMIARSAPPAFRPA